MYMFVLFAALSFAIAMVIGPGCLKWLHKLKFGSTENALGPKSHQAKSGTPVMGGVIFFVPILILTLVLLFGGWSGAYTPIILATTVLFAAIGFTDDYTKLSKKRSEGLTPKQKMIPMLAISLGVSIWAYLTPGIGSKLIVPFSGAEWDVGIFYIPLMTFILVGTVNSANLLDGVDGLLSSCASVDFVAMGAVCLCLAGSLADERLRGVMLFCAAAFGGVLGFLRFNTHPAKVFMGDGGSFTIGAALVAVAMITRTSLLLPFVALAMFVSSLSDIIQVGYFKYTKKKTGTGQRVFRMAPLHHHFELGGMDETRIVWMYTAVTVLLCMLSLGTFIR